MPKIKILIVEDDKVTNMLLTKFLSKEGYEVSSVFNGNDAIHTIMHNEFDLIITDILLPGKEGVEVIQEAKEISPQLKIIAISAGGPAGHSGFLGVAMAHGADASIAKPFAPEDILQAINRLIAA